MTDYAKMYAKINRIMGTFTPLRADCGRLCGCACCKGDDCTGMRLFPHEQTTLKTREIEGGDRLAVCDGTCNREERPLACRIFPFFPTVDQKGKVYVEEDSRAFGLCPMIGNADKIIYDKRFFRALKRVGRILAKDPECLAFLRDTTAEIDTYRALLPAHKLQED